MLVETLPINEIVIRNRLRSKLNEKTITELMESIKKIGLEELPCIHWVKEGDDNRAAVLVVGWHRLEAWRRLGHEWIDCRIFEGDEIEARKWEIAENLHRAELTKQERAEHIFEWAELTKEKLDQLGSVSTRGITEGRGNKGGTRAAVRELGIDLHEAQRAEKIAKTAPEAKAAAKEAGLSNNQSALVRIGSQPSAEAQLAAVQREKARQEEIKTQRKIRPKRTKTNRKTPRPDPEQRMKAARKYLAGRLDENELRTFGEMLIGICDPFARMLMREHV